MGFPDENHEGKFAAGKSSGDILPGIELASLRLQLNRGRTNIKMPVI